MLLLPEVSHRIWSGHWERMVSFNKGCNLNCRYFLLLCLLDCESSTAIRCLAYFLTVKEEGSREQCWCAISYEGSTSKALQLICQAYIYNDYSYSQRGTPPQEAIDSCNNHPHIVKFIDVTSDVLPQYFVAIEQQLLIECKSLERAIFIMLAAHYVFNMEYHSMVKDVFYFLQEKVFDFPDTTTNHLFTCLPLRLLICIYLMLNIE